MLLAAGGVLANAALSATSPPPAALLLPVLDALVVMVALRARTRMTLATALPAAAAFLAVRLTASSAGVADLASALLGAAAVLASALLALKCRRALDGAQAAIALAAGGARSEPVGRARAQWLLAEARRGRRLVTLGLVGVDVPADWEMEPGERERVMSELDEVLGATFGEAGAVSEHGPWERLLVLPDVWAEDFRETAHGLVRTARQRVGRQVRVALTTFPLDGPPGVEPVEYLERSLEVCRAGRTSVSVGRPRLRRVTAGHEIA